MYGNVWFNLKFFTLLTPQEIRRGILLFMMILIMALLDTIGVASVLPFMAVLADPEIIQTNIFLNNFYNLKSIWC